MADEPFDVVIPFELEAGVYAEALTGWSTADGLVLDFAVAREPGQLLVTSRVRVPATAAFEVRRAFDKAISDYELQYGEIRRPRSRVTSEANRDEARRHQSCLA